MKVTKINNFNEFVEIIMPYRVSDLHLFRGQSNKNWTLVPKVGRSSLNNINDKSLFKQWKRRAIAYLEKENFNEWELLAIAQHTGLPTRLLDWSLNPLIAAFFACNEEPKNDGALFVCKSNGYIDLNKHLPFDNLGENIVFVQPSSSTKRIINQFGYFSIHYNPSLDLNSKADKFKLEKIVIPKNLKREFVFNLHFLGVNNLSIFPDLEGLSKHLTWFFINDKNWDRETTTSNRVANYSLPPTQQKSKTR